jgi:ethanolamine utilization protein EutN
VFIAEVLGSVVSSHKTDNMDGLSLRIVRKISPDNLESGDAYMVAVDAMGVSEGEWVLVATGSTARQTHLTDNRPVDAVIMAIVDMWQTADIVRYIRSEIPSIL